MYCAFGASTDPAKTWVTFMLWNAASDGSAITDRTSAAMAASKRCFMRALPQRRRLHDYRRVASGSLAITACRDAAKPTSGRDAAKPASGRDAAKPTSGGKARGA